MKTISLALLLMALSFTSAALAKIDSNENAFSACYLPTESNVAYSQLIKLPTSSPNEIIPYGENRLQFGELWLPPSSNKNTLNENQQFKHPLVVFIHGGCWLNEYDISHSHAFSTALSQAGYAVWAVEYRRTGDEGGGWPGSYQDIKAAIRYVPKLRELPVDINNIAIAGHSAGGHLALLAATDKNLNSDVVVRSFIGLAPILDIVSYAKGDNSCQIATPAFMGGMPEDKTAEYAAATPLEKKAYSDTLLLHGMEDVIVNPKQSKDSGFDTKLIEGGGHFDLIHPGTPAFQELLKSLARTFSK